MAPSQKSAHISAKRANGVKKPLNMVSRALFPKAGKSVKADKSVKGRPIPDQKAFDGEIPPTNSGNEEWHRNVGVLNFCKKFIVPITTEGNTCPCPNLF